MQFQLILFAVSQDTQLISFKRCHKRQKLDEYS